MFSLLVQLIGILPGLDGLHPYLLSTQFDAWQGFLRVPVDWAPIVRAVWVCALYALPALAAAAPRVPATRRRGRIAAVTRFAESMGPDPGHGVSS